jgi:hypothetical protein
MVEVVGRRQVGLETREGRMGDERHAGAARMSARTGKKVLKEQEEAVGESEDGV